MGDRHCEYHKEKKYVRDEITHICDAKICMYNPENRVEINSYGCNMTLCRVEGVVYESQLVEKTFQPLRGMC